MYAAGPKDLQSGAELPNLFKLLDLSPGPSARSDVSIIFMLFLSDLLKGSALFSGSIKCKDKNLAWHLERAICGILMDFCECLALSNHPLFLIC